MSCRKYSLPEEFSTWDFEKKMMLAGSSNGQRSFSSERSPSFMKKEIVQHLHARFASITGANFSNPKNSPCVSPTSSFDKFPSRCNSVEKLNEASTLASENGNEVPIQLTSLTFDIRTCSLRGSILACSQAGICNNSNSSVCFRHTHDSWVSFADQIATKVVADAEGESFYFTVDLVEAFGSSNGEVTVEFAICYTDDSGKEHWENNKGKNFLITIREAAKPVPLAWPCGHSSIVPSNSTISLTSV